MKRLGFQDKMGSWSFIIVQSAIPFVRIAGNLVGAIRGSGLSVHSSQSRAFVPRGLRRFGHHDEPEPPAGHRSQGSGEQRSDQCEGGTQE